MTTSHAETAAFDWDTYLQEKSGRRATEVLRIFGQDYMTSATESANELYDAYMHNSLDAQRAKEQYASLPPEEFKQIWGIATDFPVLNDYVTSHNNHPKLHSEQLTEAEVANEISQLLELAESINLETVLIGAAHCLALMETYDPRSAEVRAALSQAEFIYASLCEIIGFDGLAMALRSKVECIRLYNMGDDHIVNESERIALQYQDSNGDYQPRVHSFISGILQETVGDCDHEPVLMSDSMHGVVIEEGACDEEELRIIARLKSVGSRASKLLRNFQKYGVFEPNMDDIGITLVAKDNEHLAESYIAMVRKMIASEKITTYPSPSRNYEFHVSGDQEFVDYIQQRITSEFALEDDRFEYIPDITGFNVAKATGFYEDEKGCIAFETQVLTQQGRKDSRSGRSAHVFYKLMRFFGQRYVPNDAQIAAVASFNNRKEHMGTNGLCPASEARYADFISSLQQDNEPL